MKSFKKLSIRMQVLIIGAIIISMIPIVIIKVYQQTSAIIINQNTQYNKELVFMLKQKLSANYTNTSNLLMNLGYDTTIQALITEKDKLGIYHLSKNAQSLLGVVKSTNKDILDIVTAGYLNIETPLVGKMNDIHLDMQKLKDDGSVQYIGYRKEDNLISKDKFLFGMNIYASGDTALYGDKIGYIAIALDVNSIKTELERYPRLTESTIIVMDDNDVVYTNNSNNDELLHQFKQAGKDADGENGYITNIKGKDYVIQSFDLPEISGSIITAVPIHSLIKELDSLRKSTYILLVIFLLLFTIPYTILTMNILNPLTKLMQFMIRLKSENLDVLHTKVALEGYAEIEVISNQFNTMLESVHDLTGQLIETTTRLYQVDLEKQRAEFAFLQSQINPHFLSNTLDSIKGIAIVKGNRDIYEMTNALSTMLRYTIKAKDEVSLEDELKIAAACVKIHQGRFPDRMTFELSCPDDLKTIPVPKMIIQPILENALTHGLEPFGKGGSLLLRVEKRNMNNVVITIADNGVGIDSDDLSTIIDRLNMKNVSSSEHIGVQNVHNRLWLKYGDPYGIKIVSTQGEGTTVTIQLPIKDWIY
ncbi:sensor histidine kinase [Paenibacillus sp. CMAA1364]